MAERLRLDLDLVLPDIDPNNSCAALLPEQLRTTRGIQEAPIVRENGSARLCLHYDPNLLPLGRVGRIAEQTGASISDRYRHERLPFVGLDAADSAEAVADELARLPGVQHASASYAAGFFAVAYDTQVIRRPHIERAIRRMGARIARVPGPPRSVAAPAGQMPDHAGPSDAHAATAADAHAGHDHGGAPGFLPTGPRSAGLLTSLIWAHASLFYRYRQHRWRRLVARGFVYED